MAIICHCVFDGCTFNIFNEIFDTSIQLINIYAPRFRLCCIHSVVCTYIIYFYESDVPNNRGCSAVQGADFLTRHGDDGGRAFITEDARPVATFSQEQRRRQRIEDRGYRMCKTEGKTSCEVEDVAVEDKIGRVTRHMREVREMADTHRAEEVSLRGRRMVQIITELEDIRDDLVKMVTGKLSARQMEFLEATESEEESDLDPSVQFFGVEWDSVFARCFNLGLNIRIFKARLAADCVDLAGLAVAVAEVRGVRRLMEAHRAALHTGALSGEQRASMRRQQEAVARAGRGGARYGGAGRHRTENLATILPAEAGRQRRKSVAVLPQARKSSFLENVSHLLSYIKN